jgi:hypothetical protein
MKSPKRQITAIVRVDAAEVARLEVEEAVLKQIAERARDEWLDKFYELRDARMLAENATELVDVVTRAERIAS